MDTQKQFPVGVLFENEARNLFENIVGDLAKTPEIQPNMLKIVKECSGLPIAITTVANTLKNEKDIHVWEDAVNLFKMSDPIKIDGMDEKLVTPLILLYTLSSQTYISFSFFKVYATVVMAIGNPEHYLTILSILGWISGLNYNSQIFTLTSLSPPSLLACCCSFSSNQIQCCCCCCCSSDP